MDLGALQRDDLAGRDLVDVDAAERVERARLGGDRVAAVGQAADAHRAEAPRVADGDHAVVGEDDQRVGALPRRQRALEALLPGAPPAAASISVITSVSLVAVRPKPRLSSSSRSAGALTRLPLWATASGPCIVSTRNGWIVAQGVGAGGAVAGVADGVVAGERCHRLGGEHVGDQAGVLVQARPAAVADRDAGGLLAAVLQREQAEEGDLGDPSPCGVDTPNTPHSSCGDVGSRTRRTSNAGAAAREVRLVFRQAACPRTSADPVVRRG